MRLRMSWLIRSWLAVTSGFACREAWSIDSRTALLITQEFCCECDAAITGYSAGELPSST